MRWAVIVNGPPGSGKSTLAGSLARTLSLPLFSKDAVKETLLDHLGYADRAESRRIGAASGEVLWTLLGQCSGPAIVESWLAPSTRDIVREGLRRASVDTVVEIWSTVRRRRRPDGMPVAIGTRVTSIMRCWTSSTTCSPPPNRWALAKSSPSTRAGPSTSSG